MAERLKAPVLKTGRRKPRGFESHSLRQRARLLTLPDLALESPGRGGRGRVKGEVAEWLKAQVC